MMIFLFLAFCLVLFVSFVLVLFLFGSFNFFWAKLANATPSSWEQNLEGAEFVVLCLIKCYSCL